MANRCFWVSAAELVVHMLTDGDCLQSHRHQCVVWKQLQGAMQQCKRHLNGAMDLQEPLGYQSRGCAHDRRWPLAGAFASVFPTYRQMTSCEPLGDQGRGCAHGHR